MEQGTVQESLIGGVLSEFFVILFGLCSVLVHRLPSPNSCFGDKLLSSDEVSQLF